MQIYYLKAAIPGILAFFLSSCSTEPGCNPRPAIKSDKAVEAAVERTLRSLSLEQKAGQMIQINLDVIADGSGRTDPDKLATVIGTYKVGSILNCPGRALSAEQWRQTVSAIQEVSMRELGIPCLYGLDQIHGATYTADGTFFPQEINIAASFNTDFAAAMGKAIAYETRSCMVPWTFSPVMDLGRNPAWPRNWESFGEDPWLQAVMASAETAAIQGDDPNNVDTEHIAVCAKHYLGYGAPVSGMDRTPAVIDYPTLREKFFEPFKACIEAGALSVMVSSASINGIPTHCNRELITGWLKEGLNWDGMVVTDWADINNLFIRDHVAADRREALASGINAGIDMIMDPYDPTAATDIADLVREGLISPARVDDAVRRILRLKYRLGLFESPVWDCSGMQPGGSEDFTAASYRAAVESEVLLKNNGVLPLAKGSRILVTGPNANSIRTLNGGWSYTWQGSELPPYTSRYNTVYSALSERFDTRFVEGVRYEGSDWRHDAATSIPAAVSAAQGADVIVACIGENSYCETPGNIQDLTLSANQIALVKALAATGKPIVLVLNEGRPRIIREIEPLADAIIDIMLPGNYGADALAALVAGEENFSAKLPFTYPKYPNALHTYDYKVSEHREIMEGAYNYDAVMDVQWPFGTGLSYTAFEYSNLRASAASFRSGDRLAFSVDVTNTGDAEGKEAVLLYSSDILASVMPDIRRLRAFDKISLRPGETKTVTLYLDADDLAFVGADGRWRLEAGDFRIAVGGLSVNVSCTATKVWKTQNRI